MILKKIIVDTFLTFNNGSQERKEFEFDKYGHVNQVSIVKYIKDNTHNCVNVVILDVWHEIENSKDS